MRGARSALLVLGVLLGVLVAVSGAAAAGEAPNGYRVINATDFGKVVATQKAGVSSVQVALLATLRDLAPYFGVRPQVKSAYVNPRDVNTGGARFVLTANGRPLRGFILCKIGPAGANVAVVFARMNTPREEWKRLTRARSAPKPASPASGAKASGAPARGPVQAAHLPLRQYKFPDGTGTIGLPEGWRTNSQSEMGGIIVTGPGDQLMLLGVPASVVTPNSQTVQMQRQLGAPFPPTMLVAPYTTPLEVFKALVPQLSRLSMSQGGAGFAIDNAVQLQTYKPSLPGGRAAQLSVGVTERQKHYKALVQIEIDPIPPDSFTMFQTAYRAPDATIDRDLPVMIEIANSVRENGQTVRRKSNEQIAANQQQFEAFQHAQRQKSADFDRQFNANERASNERLRSADDTDEYIRGVRTVEDTQTGEKASVDLGEVDRVVDGLNENDPERYRQIPLRDEANPEQ